MPYILNENRDKFNECIEYITENIFNSGELNYVISKVISELLQKQEQITYNYLNEIMGVLECSKLELYRRMASPYEDLKIKENGDVYNAIS